MAAPVFLNLARKYGLSYGSVLIYADFIEKLELRYWTKEAINEIVLVLSPEQMASFMVDMRNIMLEWAEIKAGKRNPFTGELYEDKGTTER